MHSLALLKSSCNIMFKQSSGLGNEPCILSRSATARSRFMFSALANPLSGVPTVEDVLGVVSRPAYPKPSTEFLLVRERPVWEFTPFAKRLLPKDLPQREETVVEVEKIRPLVKLCYAVRSLEKAAADNLLGTGETLRCDQSLKGAESVGAAPR